MTTETDPKNESATFAYDALGQLTSSTDRLGKRTDFTYDGESRKLTEKWYNSGGSLVQTQTFTYDAVGNILTADDPDGTYTMTYDALNRTTRVDGFFGVVLTFSYDAVGNRTQVEDNKSSGKGIFTSTYDAANQLTSKKVAWGLSSAALVEFTYATDGQVLEQQLYSSLTPGKGGGNDQRGATYAYDSAGRVSNIQHRNAQGTLFGNLTYTYDIAHRALTEVTNGTTKTYTYDVVDQLTADSTATFTYDATGNRNNGSYSTSAANETTTDGTWTYTYDDAGQRTAKSKGASAETWVYEYDHDGYLTLIEKRNTSGGSAVLRTEYAYDAFGNRISRVQSISGASTERYVVDGWKTNLDPLGNTGNFIGQENWDVILDLDASNDVTQCRMYGTEVDQPLGRMTGLGASWYRTDRQGSVRWVTNVNLTGTMTYDGFGRILTSTGSADRYSYTGREYDTGTATTGTGGQGLLHLRDRMLALDIGKFITRDRLGFDAGDTNLVRYVGNGYTNASDPSGMQSPPRTVSERIIDQLDWEQSMQRAWRESPSLTQSGASPANSSTRIGRMFDRYVDYHLIPTVEGLGDAAFWLVRKSGPGQIYYMRTNLRELTEFWSDPIGNTKTTVKNLPKQTNFVQIFETKDKIKAIINGSDSEDEIKHIIDNSREMGRASGIAIVLGAIPQPRINTPSGGSWSKPPSMTDAQWQSVLSAKMANAAKQQTTGLHPAMLTPLMPNNTKPATTTTVAQAQAQITDTCPVVPPVSENEQDKKSKPCFAAGTYLLTPEGMKPIEQFVEGDMVLARSEWATNDTVEAKVVQEVFRRVAPIVHVHVGGQVIRTTDNHPFYVAFKGWVEAGNLVPGDHVLSHDGRWIAIEEVFDTGEWEVVYNLTIADYHTYYVSGPEWGFSVWAHNACLVLVPVTATTGMSYARWAWDERTKQKKGGRPLDDGSKWQTGGGNIGYITLDPNPLARPNFPFISNKNGHAEEHMMNNAFVDGAVKKGGAIIAIFTERSPCNDPNHMCLEKLEKWVAPQKEPDVVYCYYIIQYQGGTKDSQGAELLKAYRLFQNLCNAMWMKAKYTSPV